MDDTLTLSLTGVRVLEPATVAAAPAAKRMMISCGADVTKAETPGGNLLHPVGWGHSLPAQVDNNPLFHLVNTGKRMVMPDLKKPEGMVALGRILEFPELLSHLVTAMCRSGKAKCLSAKTEALMKTRPCVRREALFAANDIPSERLCHYSEVSHDPQALANDCFDTVSYSDGRTPAMPVPPIGFSDYVRRKTVPHASHGTRHPRRADGGGLYGRRAGRSRRSGRPGLIPLACLDKRT